MLYTARYNGNNSRIKASCRRPTRIDVACTKRAGIPPINKLACKRTKSTLINTWDLISDREMRISEEGDDLAVVARNCEGDLLVRTFPFV